MKKLSHEGLKIIAYIAVAIETLDFLLPVVTMNTVYGMAVSVPIPSIVGRIAFPIFCYLIGEGYRHTGDRRKYGLRLLLGALITEIPFDMALYDRIYLGDANPIFTLFVGYCCICALGGSWNIVGKALFVAAAAAIAEILDFNYGAAGVLLIVALWLSGFTRHERWLQAAALLLSCFFIDVVEILVGHLSISIQFFSLFAMIPLCLYSGEKKSTNRIYSRLSYCIFPLIYLIRWGYFLIER